MPPALRTLVISDLHLGNRAHHDVLRLPGPRARLLEALQETDRLVLLGDLAELMRRNPRRSLAVAEPVFRAIGRQLGAGREVIIVPGNHDGPLVRAWTRQQGERLSVAQTVPPDASRALERVVSWLAPARVSVRYPGVWLTDRIWATHGHYLERYLIPQSAFGVLRRGRGARSRRRQRPVDYERVRHSARVGPDPLLARLLRRPASTVLEGTAEFVRAATLPVPRLLLNARLAPLTAAAIDFQMQHASIPAMAHVVQRLGIEADWVVFGHVHRTGPLPGDRADRWRAPDGGGGRVRFLNTGSWLYEPLLVDRATPPQPYWPGGAVLLEPGAEPRALGLLDGIAARDLRDGSGPASAAQSRHRARRARR